MVLSGRVRAVRRGGHARQAGDGPQGRHGRRPAGHRRRVDDAQPAARRRLPSVRLRRRSRQPAAQGRRQAPRRPRGGHAGRARAARRIPRGARGRAARRAGAARWRPRIRRRSLRSRRGPPRSPPIGSTSSPRWRRPCRATSGGPATTSPFASSAWRSGCWAGDDDAAALRGAVPGRVVRARGLSRSGGRPQVCRSSATRTSRRLAPRRSTGAPANTWRWRGRGRTPPTSSPGSNG